MELTFLEFHSEFWVYPIRLACRWYYQSVWRAFPVNIQTNLIYNMSLYYILLYIFFISFLYLLRDGSKRGLYNFIQSLLTLLIDIHNFNAQYVSVEYFEQANLLLEDATLIYSCYCTEFGKVRTLSFKTS